MVHQEPLSTQTTIALGATDTAEPSRARWDASPHPLSSRDAGENNASSANTSVSASKDLDAGTRSDTQDAATGDAQLCENACEKSLELPCRIDQCRAYCLDELSRDCAVTYRAYLECQVSRPAEEFTCDLDDYLLAPAACLPEEETFVDCLLR